MAVPQISVVIPSFNEATYIDRLLNALTRQSFEEFEVIVSDAESKDSTVKVVEGFKDRLNVRLISAPPKGPGFGRNVGARAARGEWLLFMDADGDIDDPDFLKTLLGVTKHRGWGTSSAAMKPMPGSPFKERIILPLFYRYQKLLSHTRRPVAQGWCIFTKRSAFEEANGFSERIMFGEDNDYVTRAGRKHGFGFIDDTCYYVDGRRNQEEGLRAGLKGLWNEVLRLSGYDLGKQPIRYEFGKHQERRKS